MNKLGFLMCGVSVVSACVAGPGDDPADDPATSTAVGASESFFPMGFIRVDALGGSFGSFNSAGAAISPVHLGAGSYQVTFNGLTSASGDSSGGTVQLTAETTTNNRCRILNWGGVPNVTINVSCASPSGTLADTGFDLLFYRNVMPAPASVSAVAAYSWITADGAAPTTYDYNSSGRHNTVTRTSAGNYSLTIPGAADNASMMVSTYSGTGTTCTIGGWGGGTVSVQCRNPSSVAVDNAFSFSYAVSGPAYEQQGGHTWFDGTNASTSYTSALGKVAGCSAASVTASRSNAQVTIKVTGGLGPWDSSPFVRASFSTLYGQAGYCNIVSEYAVEGTVSSGQAVLQCFDPTGAVIAAPRLTYTQVTSDAAGAC